MDAVLPARSVSLEVKCEPRARTRVGGEKRADR